MRLNCAVFVMALMFFGFSLPVADLHKLAC